MLPWETSIFWMSLILACTYGSIMIISGIWFIYRRNLQPIKARIPSLVICTQACLFIYMAFNITRGLTRETMPCWMDSFGAHFIVGIVAQLYLLRCWVLYFCFNLTQAKLHGYALSVRDYHDPMNDRSPSMNSQSPSTGGKSSTGSFSSMPLSPASGLSSSPMHRRPTSTHTLPVIRGSDADTIIDHEHDISHDEIKENTTSQDTSTTSTFMIPSYFLQQAAPEALPTPFPITKGLIRTSIGGSGSGISSQTTSSSPPEVTTTMTSHHHPQLSTSTFHDHGQLMSHVSNSPSASVSLPIPDEPQLSPSTTSPRMRVASIPHGYQQLLYEDIDSMESTSPQHTTLDVREEMDIEMTNVTKPRVSIPAPSVDLLGASEPIPPTSIVTSSPTAVTQSSPVITSLPNTITTPVMSAQPTTSTSTSTWDLNTDNVSHTRVSSTYISPPSRTSTITTTPTTARTSIITGTSTPRTSITTATPTATRPSIITATPIATRTSSISPPRHPSTDLSHTYIPTRPSTSFHITRSSIIPSSSISPTRTSLTTDSHDDSTFTSTSNDVVDDHMIIPHLPRPSGDRARSLPHSDDKKHQRHISSYTTYTSRMSPPPSMQRSSSHRTLSPSISPSTHHKRVSLIPAGENIRRLATLFDPVNAQLIRSSPSHTPTSISRSITPRSPLPAPPPPPTIPSPPSSSFISCLPSHTHSRTPSTGIQPKSSLVPTHVQTTPMNVSPQSDALPMTPGSAWFIKKKNLVRWPFLFTCIFIGISLQMTIPIVSFFTDPNVRSTTNGFSCHQRVSRYGLAVVLGLYITGFLWFARALAPVTDGFGMKRELKYVAIIAWFTMIIWVLFQSIDILYAFDHETFGFTTLLLTTSCLAIWIVSTVQPLWKTYDPDYMGFAHDKIDTLEEILETEAGLASFRNFLVSEFSVENILFYEEIMTFRGKYGIPTDRNDPSTSDLPRRRRSLFPQKPIRNEKRMRADARLIYQKYVVDGSDLQVNLSSSVHSTLARRLEAPYKDVVYLHAQHRKQLQRQAKRERKQQRRTARMTKHTTHTDMTSTTRSSTGRVWNKRTQQRTMEQDTRVSVMDVNPLHAHNKNISLTFDPVDYDSDMKSPSSRPAMLSRSASPSGPISSGSIIPTPHHTSTSIKSKSDSTDPDPLDTAQCHFTCQIFDEAQQQCLGHMKRDHFVRYLNTQMYRALVTALETEKRVLHDMHIT